MDELEIFQAKIDNLISEYGLKDNIPEYIKRLSDIKHKVELYQKQNFLALNSKTKFLEKVKAFFQKIKYRNFKEIKRISLEDLYKESADIYFQNIMEPQDTVKSNGKEGPISGIAGDQYHELYFKILEALRYYKGIEKTETGAYKVYPYENDEEVINQYKKELYKIAQDFFKNDKSEKQLMIERKHKYVAGINKTRNEVMDGEVEPYHGSVNFIYERSKFIVECIFKILQDKSIDEKYKENAMAFCMMAEQELEYIEEKRKNINNLGEAEFKKAYREIEESYLKIKTYEDIISQDVHEIWNQFLTNPKDYKPGEHFAYFAHTFTDGAVKTEDINKVCCTLVTDRCMPIPYGNYGIICRPTNEQISTMCTGDAGSWIIGKEQFFEEFLDYDRQFAEESGVKGKKMAYEEPKISKLILPSTMEEAIITDNEKYNGEPLNYRKSAIYSEIYVVPGDKTLDVQSMFSFNGKDKDVVERLQHEEGYSDYSIELNLNDARKMHGLEPIDLEKENEGR